MRTTLHTNESQYIPQVLCDVTFNTEDLLLVV